MAFSRSIKGAQIPKPCELCETDTNIKWKCVQCNTLMCEKCKKIHLKVQTSITHDIVDVKGSEAKKEQEHTIITDNIPCQIHKKKLNCMFCRTCDRLVCPDCITASHKKHDLDSIETVCNERREKLKEIESKFSEKFTLCEKENSKVRDFKAKYEQFSAESVQKINQQEKLIMNEVIKYAKALREQIESEKQRIEKSITEKEKQMAEVKETLLYKQSNIQEVLESNQAAYVFNTFSEFRKNEIPDASFEAFPDESKNFFPTKGSLMNMTNLFGSLQKSKLPKGLPQVNLDVIKSYTTDFNTVDGIIIQDDKTAWICDDDIPTLHKINIDDKITTVKDISRLFTVPFIITSNVNNDILVIDRTCNDDERVIVLDRDGQVKWTYQGNNQVNSGDKLFNPADIVTTSDML
ncbi:uncharacterized protein LOC127719380 [Mytilus californianus]|uniref:uncharacterized protein LOC127719380 n=1 Tax=Mytilus californianus TaxID=6549 RepID=UPI0022475122|nr:uncharacterized protein LOC127719380 [Mytilus californianus]